MSACRPRFRHAELSRRIGAGHDRRDFRRRRPGRRRALDDRGEQRHAEDPQADSVGLLRAQVKGRNSLGLRLQIVDPAPQVKAALTAQLQRLLDSEAALKTMLKERRALTENMLEEALRKGEISSELLFDDDNYNGIPGTNPAQFRTASLDFLERTLPAILEPAMAADPNVVFCIAVDHNGYAPVHNRDYSQEQGADSVWNEAHCRNRRIFDDGVGLAAARNAREFLVQTYPREMGNGKIHLVKDISTPLMVRGKPSGYLRLGVKVG